MTVCVAQNRINTLKRLGDQLGECASKLNKEESSERIKTLEEDFGITSNLLAEAAQYLSITAKEFQDDLDNCEVNCKCW